MCGPLTNTNSKAKYLARVRKFTSQVKTEHFISAVWKIHADELPNGTAMLKEIEISIIELGHSERRHVMMESNEDISKKMAATVAHGFISSLCVGETLRQKDDGCAKEIISIQLKMLYARIFCQSKCGLPMSRFGQ